MKMNKNTLQPQGFMLALSMAVARVYESYSTSTGLPLSYDLVKVCLALNSPLACLLLVNRDHGKKLCRVEKKEDIGSRLTAKHSQKSEKSDEETYP
jgi:hypothetical protein